MRATPIGSLISPIPDESGYGVLCRTAKLMGFADLKTLMNYLIPSAINNEYALPKDIELTTLSAWSIHVMKITPIEAADRFSNLPLFRPFLKSPPRICFQRPGHWPQNLSNPQWWRPLGMETGRQRYCIHCAREQHEKHGFTTWMRSQNVAGVVACEEHKSMLIEMLRSQPLLPPIQTPADASAYASGIAPPEEIVHSRYVRDILDGNLPWIPPALQDRVVRRQGHNLYREHLNRHEFSHCKALPSPRKKLRTYLGGDFDIRNMRTGLDWLKRDFEDFQVFKELHFAAAADFEYYFDTHLKLTPGRVLTLKV